MQQPTRSDRGQHPTRSDRGMFSDDSVMMKQIQGTHAPDGREFDVKSIIYIVEEIMRSATPSINDVLNGTHEHETTMEDNPDLASVDEILEALAYVIQKISCEISCKCSGGGDAHGTTISILNMLSYYSWNGKMVIALAAFVANYGEFWLVAQLCTTNSLAKSVALFKQLPSILENYNSLKPQFDAINNLIKTSLDVTKCIIEFKELPTQYISSDTPPLSVAVAHIPMAAYWTVRSIVACASQIVSLMNMRHEYITSTAEPWELSSLAHKLSSIHEHLKKQIALCYQHIDEKRQIETYQNLVRLFETIHMDNMKVLRALISSTDDLQPLVDGSMKAAVSIEVLRKRHVLLLISDLGLSHEEILVLRRMYEESKARPDHHYEVLWLPIIDRSLAWSDEHELKFESMQEMMPWYSVQHPSMIEPAVIKYIKEKWHFTEKPILVSLDPQGRVLCQNAFHMLWIWGNLAFPFVNEKEEALWKSETWRLELLVDAVDIVLLELMKDGRFICLYGGEDIDWIRKFITETRSVAEATQTSIEMVYMGKSNAIERVRKLNSKISEENLSHCLSDLTSVWFFWARLESMLYSKLLHGKTAENDKIMQEIMNILSYDGSDQGWAIFSSASKFARVKGNVALNAMSEFDKWKEDAEEKGFLQGLNNYLEQVQTPHHCNKLILPGISGGIPERVVCAECGRPMEKFFMYRCCVD